MKKPISLIMIFLFVLLLTSCSLSNSATKNAETGEISSSFAQFEMENSAEFYNNDDNETKNGDVEKSTQEATKEQNSLGDKNFSTVPNENQTENTKGKLNNSTSKKTDKTSGKNDKNKSGKPNKTTKASGTTKSNNNTVNKTTSSTKSCTITIECKEVLNNMDKLSEGTEKYIPANGYLVESYEYSFKGEKTVYDALKSACNKYNYYINFSNTYGMVYIRGINQIDEFDCGKSSGWMYSVNSKKPAISCNNYKISNGDKVVFSFVCEYHSIG